MGRRTRRITPTRPTARTRSCGKLRFETFHAAKAAALLQQEKHNGPPLRHYYHEQCQGFHLTSQI